MDKNGLVKKCNFVDWVFDRDVGRRPAENFFLGWGGVGMGVGEEGRENGSVGLSISIWFVSLFVFWEFFQEVSEIWILWIWRRKGISYFRYFPYFEKDGQTIHRRPFDDFEISDLQIHFLCVKS